MALGGEGPSWLLRVPSLPVLWGFGLTEGQAVGRHWASALKWPLRAPFPSETFAIRFLKTGTQDAVS